MCGPLTKGGDFMSKSSRRPGREAMKAQRKAHEKAQQELREKQKAEGLDVPPSATISNCKCSCKTEEEEKEMRTDAVTQQVKIYRAALPGLLNRLNKIPDPRNPRKVKHRLTVLLIYGILCFAFQMASRREATREMTRPMFMANLRHLFPELEALPHHDTLARLLERIDVTDLEQAHLAMIRHLIRGKKFKRYLIQGCYPVVFDGTQKFKRTTLWAEECLARKVRGSSKIGDDTQEPEKQYYVYVLEANLAFHNGMVIPLLSEILSYTEGDSDRNKQDCEQRAFKRLAERLKKSFRCLPIMVLLDGLYANGPVIELCRKYKWDYMIVLQDKSLSSVWEEVDALMGQQPENHLRREWGNRKQHFQWVNDIDYWYICPITKKEKKQPVHVVICEESWEEIAPNSTEVVTKTSRHVWISEQPLHKRTVHERCNLGARHRWGIESSILVEKHQGYEYEHCFSYNWNAMRGYHYLMRLAHALNVLARYSYAMAKHVRAQGVQGLIDLVRNTLASPWIEPEVLRRIAAGPCQIRLE